MQIGILGSGDYATALAYRFSNSRNVVNWYIRRQEDRERLLSTGHHKHFPDYQFNMNYIKVMGDVMSVVQESDIIILAIPSAYIDDELNNIWYCNIPSRPWVVMSKGLVSISSIMQCDIIDEYLRMILNDEWSDIFVLSGPSHAEEIIMGKFSALGCAHMDNGRDYLGTHWCRADIQNMFKSIDIHVSSESVDAGVLQYSSILKNIYGIGAGVVDSLNAGDNAKALFSTMCINELSSFLINLYQDYECTNKDKLYTVGDVLVTMYSNHSRNYRLGRNIVEGNIPALGEKCQVEGLNTITTLHQYTAVEPKIRKLKELPVVRFVSDCIYKASGNREKIDDMFRKLLYSHL